MSALWTLQILANIPVSTSLDPICVNVMLDSGSMLMDRPVQVWLGARARARARARAGVVDRAWL